MKEYNNYIFDLYGTLIDIWTDEHGPKFWRIMAKQYNIYGCDWKPQALHEKFFELDREERKFLSERNGSEFPEIKLERVFARVLFECPQSHEVEARIAGKNMSALRAEYTKNKEKVLKTVIESDWCYAIANQFRICSHKRLKLFKTTISTLDELRARGKKLYLLSNAQHIFTMPEIEMLGLAPHLDKMYISSDYGIMKPDPKFMETLIKNEGLNKDECVMVGNELRADSAIALKCGMDSIILNTSFRNKEDIEKERKALVKQIKGADKHVPAIVMSGDIAEILP